MKDWQGNMRVKVCTISPYDSVRKAYEVMTARNIRHLLVTDAQKLCGVISDRDVLKATSTDEGGIFSFPKKTVDQIMMSDLKTCQYTADTETICEVMLANKIDCVPILDGDVIKGLITSTDLVRLLKQIDQGRNRKAFDVAIEEST